MIEYTKFKDKIDSSNLKEFSFRGFEVSIDEDLSVKIDGDLILENADSYTDAIEYAKRYIGNLQHIGENTIVIKDKLVQLIEKHHATKVTNTLIEAYEELIASDLFTLDPVIHWIAVRILHHGHWIRKGDHGRRVLRNSCCFNRGSCKVHIDPLILLAAPGETAFRE